MELVEQLDPEDRDAFGVSETANYSALFIGGSGSDTIVELPFEVDDGGSAAWAETSLSLTLENPQGVSRIRATPPLLMNGGANDEHQFLYVIAGDGTTHVVDRDIDDDALGIECDTQIDPSTQALPFPSCNPIDPTASGQGLAPDRRAFAEGPGIRVNGGAGFTDWAFFVSPTPSTGEDDDGNDEAEPAPETSGVPFVARGVVGVGVTSFGRVVLGAFNQLQSPAGNPSDPAGIMDLSVPPHSLWPSVDPAAEIVAAEALPLVDDEEPDRTLPGDPFSLQDLAPSLRRIDLAYAAALDPDDVSDERNARAASLGDPSNADDLGAFTDIEIGGPFYENEVVRAVARDYQSWFPTRWTLAWEGTIPGTRAATGRIECDTPGWENGTCIRTDDSDSDASRLIDESASFCDNGVLAGDKLVILGCTADDDCGLGQRCLQEPTAPASATGICVSAEAYEQDFEVLRQVCAPFITEACGQPRREYLVTRAFQTELHLQAMDRPFESHLRAVDPDTGLAPAEDEELPVVGFQENVARYTCELPAEQGVVNQPAGGQGCMSDEQCTELNGNDDEQPFVCGGDGFCRGPCPGGDPECRECEADVDCDHFGEGALCVDFQCQRPCESGQRDCVQALLPGPRCFSEFVDYVVRSRNSFTVVGDPAPGFITDRMFVDPETGECREDDNASALLTSRLRLADDEASVFTDPTVGIPDCPNADEAGPGDPNPCRIVPIRAEGETRRFHQMQYEGTTVPAIRFSNPNVSLVVDLVDLLSLASNVDIIDANGQTYTSRYPTSFAAFNRARIPRNYAEAFTAGAGYIPISEPAVVSNTVMVFPVRVVNGAFANTAYIVDAGGRGGPAGVRGQVIRVFASSINAEGAFVDTGFLVR